MLARSLEPEWLDTLPEGDARALRSRRDLVRVNALMGNAAIVASLLDTLPGSRPVRIAEIGAGDGAFASRVTARLRGKGEIVLVDRASRPSPAVIQAMMRGGWRVTAAQADVFEWLAGCGNLDAVFANLFLHHFDAPALRRMLEGIARVAPLFVACEPRRSPVALAGSRLLGVIGCNDVTRHDAVVSVRAGFTGHEISRLWPQASKARLEESRRGLFSHAFRASLP
jgi:hypothetical protein